MSSGANQGPHIRRPEAAAGMWVGGGRSTEFRMSIVNLSGCLITSCDNEAHADAVTVWVINDSMQIASAGPLFGRNTDAES